MYAIMRKFELPLKQDIVIDSGIMNLDQAQKQADLLNENLDEDNQYFYYVEKVL